jgi:hypothetical protein
LSLLAEGLIISGWWPALPAYALPAYALSGSRI